MTPGWTQSKVSMILMIFIYSVDIVMFSLTTRGNNIIITSYIFSRMDVNFNSGFSKQTFITVAT